jgi:hypothetical protein
LDEKRADHDADSGNNDISDQLSALTFPLTYFEIDLRVPAQGIADRAMPDKTHEAFHLLCVEPDAFQVDRNVYLLEDHLRLFYEVRRDAYAEFPYRQLHVLRVTPQEYAGT